MGQDKATNLFLEALVTVAPRFCSTGGLRGGSGLNPSNSPYGVLFHERNRRAKRELFTSRSSKRRTTLSGVQKNQPRSCSSTISSSICFSDNIQCLWWELQRVYEGSVAYQFSLLATTISSVFFLIVSHQLLTRRPRLVDHLLQLGKVAVGEFFDVVHAAASIAFIFRPASSSTFASCSAQSRLESAMAGQGHALNHFDMAGRGTSPSQKDRPTVGAVYDRVDSSASCERREGGKTTTLPRPTPS